MRVRMTLSLSIASVIIIFLCCTTATMAGTDSYYNQDEQFSLDIPTGWQVVEGYMETTVSIVSPTENSEDTFRENLNVVTEDLPFAVSLDDYFNSSVDSLAKDMLDFSETERAQLEIDGIPARRVGFTHMIGSVKYRVLSYMLVQGTRAYCLTCTALADTFAAYRSTFEKLALSFKCGADAVQPVVRQAVGDNAGEPSAAAPIVQPTQPTQPTQPSQPAATPAQTSQPAQTTQGNQTNTAVAAQPLPVADNSQQTNTAAQPASDQPCAGFTLQIEQDGKPVTIVNHQVTLAKHAFQIVLGLKALDGVYVNASSDPGLYNTASNGGNLGGAMAADKALAEWPLNEKRTIVLAENLVHYWYYQNELDHRFDRVSGSGGNLICRRTVTRFVQGQTGNGWDVENLPYQTIYLVFLQTRTGEYYEETEVQRDFLKIVFK